MSLSNRKKKKEDLSTSSSSSREKREKREKKGELFSPRQKSPKAVVRTDEEITVTRELTAEQEEMADLFSNPTGTKIVDKAVDVGGKQLTKEQEDLVDIFSNPTASPKSSSLSTSAPTKSKK